MKDCSTTGYKDEMFNMLQNANPGLRRRFNVDDFGIHFEVLQCVCLAVSCVSSLIS